MGSRGPGLPPDPIGQRVGRNVERCRGDGGGIVQMYKSVNAILLCKLVGRPNGRGKGL